MAWSLFLITIPINACGEAHWTFGYSSLMDLDRAIFRETDPCGGDVCISHSDDSVRAVPWPGQFSVLA